MSGTEEMVSEPTTYEDIAAIHGRRSLLYVEFGSYQGEWVMFATDDRGSYYIYKGWYGSCSGCDDIQATFGAGETTREVVDKWADDYRPFAEIPKETMRRLVMNDSVKTIFPANQFSEADVDGFVREVSLLVRLEEDLPLSAEMAIESQNQETRRRIMENVGITRFIEETLHVDGVDKLVRCRDDGRYLWLQDASTDREYLLRVPPETKTVRAGKAWSFGLDSAKEYAPLIET